MEPFEPKCLYIFISLGLGYNTKKENEIERMCENKLLSVMFDNKLDWKYIINYVEPLQFCKILKNLLLCQVKHQQV